MSAREAERTATGLDAYEDLRRAYVELLAAERRLRGRDARRQEDGARHLSMAHYRLLVQLVDVDERTAGGLAEACDLTPATVTGLVDALEAQGLVARGRSERDRRVVTVRLLDAGRELVLAKREAIREHWRRELGDLTDADVHGAADVMRRIAAVLDTKLT